METLLLAPGDPRWEEALASLPHDIYHLPAYLRVEAARVGGEPLAVWIREGEERLLLPLVLAPTAGARQEGALDALSPYGYPALLCSDRLPLDAALATLKGALAARGASSLFVRLHPLLPLPAAALERHGRLVAHGETVWLDLAADAEERRRQLRPQFRKAIRRLQEAGVTVRCDRDFLHYDRFRRLYHGTMAKNRAAGWYFFDEGYFAALREALGERLTLWLAEAADGSVAAAALIFEEGGLVQYHLGTTAPDQPYAEAMKLLLYSVGEWGAGRGNRALHLGGGLGAGNDSLFYFKSGFSHRRGRFHTWRAICDEGRFAAAVARWEEAAGRPADGPDGYFPPYRAPL